MGVLADTLRQARVQKGVTLKEAEQATRINRHYLSALEEENFAVLPALIYQRGIVRSYAAYLDLDPGKLLGMFEETRGGESTADLVAAVKPLEMPHHWAPNFAIITFMVVMSAIVFAWIYSLSFNDPQTQAPALPDVPTVTPIPSDRLALAAQSPGPMAVDSTPTSDAPSSSVAGLGEEEQAIAPAAAQAANQPLQDSPAPTATSIAVLPTVTSGNVSLERQAPPSPTPAPTNSPVPTPSPTPIPAPSLPPPTVASAPPQPPVGSATIRVVAQGDIYVSIFGDGVSLYEGTLGAGATTDWFTAGTFEVFTSNGDQTLFENAETGEVFKMGYGLDETYTLSG